MISEGVCGGSLPGTHWLARPVGSGKGCGLAGEETAANEAKPTLTSCRGWGRGAGLGARGRAAHLPAGKNRAAF